MQFLFINLLRYIGNLRYCNAKEMVEHVILDVLVAEYVGDSYLKLITCLGCLFVCYSLFENATRGRIRPVSARLDTIC